MRRSDQSAARAARIRGDAEIPPSSRRVGAGAVSRGIGHGRLADGD